MKISGVKPTTEMIPTKVPVSCIGVFVSSIMAKYKPLKAYVPKAIKMKNVNDKNIGCSLNIPKPKTADASIKTLKEGSINFEGINLSAIQPIEIAANGLKNWIKTAK